MFKISLVLILCTHKIILLRSSWAHLCNQRLNYEQRAGIIEDELILAEADTSEIVLFEE